MAESMSALKSEFTERIRMQFPADAESFIAAIDSPVKPSVRIHPRKGSAESVLPDGATPVPWNTDGYWMDERPLYTTNPEFHGGCFYPQEASSMILGHVLKNVAPNVPDEPYVLDLCAAPGGKSTLIASWLDGRGVLVANEVIRTRAWILRENIAKWGYGNCLVTNCDAGKIGAMGAIYDLVLIDAPCSGEGMFRKDDVARKEWSVENASMCAERQKEIMNDIWDAVVDGGIIVYSTCTFNPDENERQMEWIASQFDVEFLKIPMADEWNVTTLGFDGGEGYAFHPHKVKGEGFFVCVMRKTSGSDRRRLKPGKKDTFVEARNVTTTAIGSSFAIYQQADQLYAIPRKHSQQVAGIVEGLKPIWIGVPLGMAGKKEMLPAPELPLMLDYADSYPSVELDTDDMLRFLRGEWTFRGEMPQGWCVVKYHGRSYGFIKVIGNRVNNYWPKEWRIRMSI
ncbi:MAG: hypothetical protein MJZ15_07675 [Bacteroidales bacterium]|nr:hypothetical protein [Bacteroidales bacterium]